MDDVEIEIFTESMLREAENKRLRHEETVGRFNRGLEAMSVSGTSKDGSIKLTVNQHGVLTNLKLSHDALRKTPETLSGEILQGIAATQRCLVEKVNELVSTVYGSDDPAGEYILETYARSFPDGASASKVGGRT